MRGLSIIQPWASLIAGGEKRVETRTWSTRYRGDLLIHASAAFPAEFQSLCHKDPFVDALLEVGCRRSEDLPRGFVLATARLDAVIPTEEIDELWAHSRRGFEWAAREMPFGDYGPRRFAWVLTDVARLPHPLPVKGAQGLWSVSQTLLDLVAGQGVL